MVSSAAGVSPCFGVSQCFPLMCGGHDSNGDSLSNCWRLEPFGKWIEFQNMLEKRDNFTINGIEEHIIVIGGSQTTQNGKRALTHVEKCNSSKRWIRAADLPEPLYLHCTVNINKTTLMVVGGKNNREVDLYFKCRFSLIIYS